MFGMLSSEISERRNKAVATLPENAPGWIMDYISGWEACMRSFIDREVVFCYTVNGVLFSTHRDRDDYYEKCGFSPRGIYELATHSGHYWDIKGKLKPYFVEEIKRGRCEFCGANNAELIAVLVADPDQYVCTTCHVDSRIPTERIK
jgi:hypothetical protein